MFAFIALIVSTFFLDKVSTQENAIGDIESIQIYNIGYIIQSNLPVVAFLFIPIMFLFYFGRYLIKSIYTFINSFNSHTISQILSNIRKFKLFHIPSKESLKDIVLIIACIILLPTSIFLIYYYPYKSILTINKSYLNELTIRSYYLYPKKPKVQTFILNSDDSLLVHLWEPVSSGSDELTPAGQLFLYQKNSSRKELLSGSIENIKKIGNLLYEITGLTTIINKVEGYTTRPTSHKVLPSNKNGLDNNKYYLNGIPLKTTKSSINVRPLKLSYEKINISNWDSAAIELKNKEEK